MPGLEQQTRHRLGYRRCGPPRPASGGLDRVQNQPGQGAGDHDTGARKQPPSAPPRADLARCVRSARRRRLANERHGSRQRLLCRHLRQPANRRDESIAAPRHGENVGGGRGVVAERRAQGGKGLRNHSFDDEGALPDLVEKGLLRHRLARMPRQADQQVHRPRLERDRVRTALQAIQARLDAPGPELERAPQVRSSRVAHRASLGNAGRIR